MHKTKEIRGGGREALLPQTVTVCGSGGFLVSDSRNKLLGAHHTCFIIFSPIIYGSLNGFLFSYN